MKYFILFTLLVINQVTSSRSKYSNSPPNHGTFYITAKKQLTPTPPPPPNSHKTVQIENPRFDYNLIKDDIPVVKSLFQYSPHQDYLIYRSVKYVRHPESGRIFALASGRYHKNGVIGQGAFGKVKKAIDIDNPGSKIVIKRTTRGPVFEDMSSESQKLNILNLQYKNVETPIESVFHKTREVSKDGSLTLAARKQYQVMRRVSGTTLHKFVSDPKRSPQEIEAALKSASEALSDLHMKGYVHMDAHLGNFIVGRDGKTAHLIDAGRIKKAWDGNMNIRNLEFLDQPLYDHLNLNFMKQNVLAKLVTRNGQRLTQLRENLAKEGRDLYANRNPNFDNYLEMLPNHFGVYQRQKALFRNGFLVAPENLYDLQNIQFSQKYSQKALQETLQKTPPKNHDLDPMSITRSRKKDADDSKMMFDEFIDYPMYSVQQQ